MKTLNLHNSQIYFTLPDRLESEGSVLVVSDSQVAPLYLDKILSQIHAPQVFSYVLPSGEESKNPKELFSLLEYALTCKLDRKSLMIALGGGVVSDIVGLASGLYMRGIEFYSIPTTLLAQVDASVGGKCGINSPQGKNLIGIFHQPSKVFISPSFLSTLPRKEFNSGLAEVIKMAICFDSSLFNSLLSPQWVEQNLEEVIFTSISLKAHIVEQDERESNLRASLNYGHTFGHIIEQEGDYKTYLHGEAVSMGMVMANALATSCNGFLQNQEVIELLQTYHLPTHYKIPNLSSFFNALFLDKKTQNHKIKFILPKTIGSYEFAYPQEEEIMEVLREFV